MNKRLVTKRAKVSPAAPPPRSFSRKIPSAGRKGDDEEVTSPVRNPSGGRKGNDEEVEEKNIWLDPDASSVDCRICFMPFEKEMFMCKNGHAACDKCCVRMNRKCWGCEDEPIGDIRCLLAENMLGEMNTVCQFSKYGCAEVIKYAKKRQHEESCPRAPYGCPVAGCTYRGVQLYSHIMDDHGGVVPTAAYLQSTTVTLRKSVPFRVLVQPDRERVFMLLNRGGVLAGRSLSLVCLGPSPEGNGDGGISYKMEVRGCVPGSLSLEGTAPCVRVLEGFEPKKFLFVPDAEWGPCASGSVSIRIGS